MEEQLTDDSSHYEISLTAGQAFVAFVLMLLSLAASFAFGLTIGKGQLEEKIAGKRDAPAVVTEARVAPAKKQDIAVADDDFKQAPPATITEEPEPQPKPSVAPPTPAARVPLPKPSTNPAYAQLLSTTDQKVAEALAAKLIDSGFTSAYVERGATVKGSIFRVRVKFDNDSAAHVAEARLKTFSKDVWITTR